MDSLVSNTNNINIDNLSEPATKLIDKMSFVLDWNLTNMGAHRLAQKEYIEYISSADSIPAAVKPALIYNSKKIIKEFANQQDVVSYGISLLNDVVFVDDIDDEWLYEFMDGAGKASTDELKMLWGKILATECNKKESVPKRLLYILKQMDSEVASSFTKLCSTCIQFINDEGNAELQPIVISYQPKEHSIMYYNEIIELGTLGLIEYNNPQNGGYTINKLDDNKAVIYAGKQYNGLINNGVLHVGLVLFTKAGEALAKIVDTDSIPNYMEEAYIPYVKHLEEIIRKLEAFPMSNNNDNPHSADINY